VTERTATVAPLQPEDAGQAAALHAACFAEAWSAEDFRRFAEGLPYIGLAARIDAELAGVLVASAVGGESEILTFAVAPAFRRMGIGRTLLRLLIETASGLGARVIFLEAGEANHAAISLYRQCGFETAGRRAGYYAAEGGAREDALIMKRALSPPQ
jgi:ribosomal-protein-alanine N-acetyltransferase